MEKVFLQEHFHVHNCTYIVQLLIIQQLADDGPEKEKQVTALSRLPGR